MECRPHAASRTQTFGPSLEGKPPDAQPETPGPQKKTRGQEEEEEGFAHGFDVEFEREGEISVQHVQANDVYGENGRFESDSASEPHGDRQKGIQPKAQGMSGFRKCCTSIHPGCSHDEKGESRRL